MWSYNEDVYSVFEGAHAVIFMTGWSIYKTLNWERILPVVKQPFWVFDTRLIVNPNEIKNLGINLWQLGNGKNH